MGDEDKSFDATPQKLEKAREQGQVIKSRDLSTALFIVVMFSMLLVMGHVIWDVIAQTFVLFFQQIPNQHIEKIGWQYMALIVGRCFLFTVGPFLLVAFMIAVFADVIQVGLLISTESIMPKPEKLNPVTGFKNIFSMNSVVELVKNILKILILGFLAYMVFSAHLPELLAVGHASTIWAILYVLGKVIGQFIFLSGIAFFVIGGADYLYQRFKFLKDQKMSMKEIKDEFKQSEGDPMVKHALRQRRMQMLQQRMLEAVPGADVVITNPLHYAVALQYQAQAMEAPRLIAKGAELFAQRIKEIATENNVPIVENPLMARTLYKVVEIDQDIPPDLYQAVAEILMFAWKVSGKTQPGATPTQ